jgi:hypothetical protein
MVHFTDANNYYRFSLDRGREYRRLVKVQGGVWTWLAEDSVQYVTDQPFQIQIVVQGDAIQVRVDGEVLFGGAIIDPAPLVGGSVGLYSWGNQNSVFEAVSVDTLSPPETLAVTVVGDGVVTSVPAGIACPADCSEGYAVGTQVTLIATANAGSVFSAWTGDAGCEDGKVTLDTGKSCTATFSLSTSLLSDDFEDGNFNGWNIVDEGTEDDPSVWAVVAGALEQSSNIFSFPAGAGIEPAELPKQGTYAWYGNGLGWTDYQVTVPLVSTDVSAIGVMVHFTDANNYYRFSMDQGREYRRLVKV